MPLPYVDRMATIQETIDNPTPSEMGEQQGPGYKLIRVAEANPVQKTFSSIIIALVTPLCTGIFPFLEFFHLVEIFIFLSLLFLTLKMSDAGISPMLFALSQLLDMSMCTLKPGLTRADFSYSPEYYRTDFLLHCYQGLHRPREAEGKA